ncbi:hypothetical protein K437DRAFT_8439 [Tilletiaria anomala UBC 951]|uniref:Uncharacterized protein n=1 Tax=Tilletiaria anomala (strain ATCC 24038 / CBS 436.72 / UBC 951) TaxID=1037660 RepID=A0A066VDD9_TILAU|nr:uncharacterized protein K437DRAFT_8439 [Tilletiaria anomala UBC 951]KDN39757.1 hypothetical protein K437DRAFT_8439 [Tilletiaria anomala UBC 951]
MATAHVVAEPLAPPGANISAQPAYSVAAVAQDFTTSAAGAPLQGPGHLQATSTPSVAARAAAAAVAVANAAVAASMKKRTSLKTGPAAACCDEPTREQEHTTLMQDNMATYTRGASVPKASIRRAYSICNGAALRGVHNVYGTPRGRSYGPHAGASTTPQTGGGRGTGRGSSTLTALTERLRSGPHINLVSPPLSAEPGTVTGVGAMKGGTLGSSVGTGASTGASSRTSANGTFDSLLPAPPATVTPADVETVLSSGNITFSDALKEIALGSSGCHLAAAGGAATSTVAVGDPGAMVTFNLVNTFDPAVAAPAGTSDALADTTIDTLISPPGTESNRGSVPPRGLFSVDTEPPSAPAFALAECMPLNIGRGRKGRPISLHWDSRFGAWGNSAEHSSGSSATTSSSCTSISNSDNVAAASPKDGLGFEELQVGGGGVTMEGSESSRCSHSSFGSSISGNGSYASISTSDASPKNMCFNLPPTVDHDPSYGAADERKLKVPFGPASCAAVDALATLAYGRNAGQCPIGSDKDSGSSSDGDSHQCAFLTAEVGLTDEPPLKVTEVHVSEPMPPIYAPIQRTSSDPSPNSSSSSSRIVHSAANHGATHRLMRHSLEPAFLLSSSVRKDALLPLASTFASLHDASNTVVTTTATTTSAAPMPLSVSVAATNNPSPVDDEEACIYGEGEDIYEAKTPGSVSRNNSVTSPVGRNKPGGRRPPSYLALSPATVPTAHTNEMMDSVTALQATYTASTEAQLLPRITTATPVHHLSSSVIASRAVEILPMHASAAAGGGGRVHPPVSALAAPSAFVSAGLLGADASSLSSSLTCAPFLNDVACSDISPALPSRRGSQLVAEVRSIKPSPSCDHHASRNATGGDVASCNGNGTEARNEVLIFDYPLSAMDEASAGIRRNSNSGTCSRSSSNDKHEAGITPPTLRSPRACKTAEAEPHTPSGANFQDKFKGNNLSLSAFSDLEGNSRMSSPGTQPLTINALEKYAASLASLRLDRCASMGGHSDASSLQTTLARGPTMERCDTEGGHSVASSVQTAVGLDRRLPLPSSFYRQSFLAEAARNTSRLHNGLPSPSALSEIVSEGAGTPRPDVAFASINPFELALARDMAPTPPLPPSPMRGSFQVSCQHVANDTGATPRARQMSDIEGDMWSKLPSTPEMPPCAPRVLKPRSDESMSRSPSTFDLPNGLLPFDRVVPYTPGDIDAEWRDLVSKREHQLRKRSTISGVQSLKQQAATKNENKQQVTTPGTVFCMIQTQNASHVEGSKAARKERRPVSWCAAPIGLPSYFSAGTREFSSSEAKAAIRSGNIQHEPYVLRKPLEKPPRPPKSKFRHIATSTSVPRVLNKLGNTEVPIPPGLVSTIVKAAEATSDALPGVTVVATPLRVVAPTPRSPARAGFARSELSSQSIESRITALATDQGLPAHPFLAPESSMPLLEPYRLTPRPDEPANAVTGCGALFQ